MQYINTRSLLDCLLKYFKIFNSALLYWGHAACNFRIFFKKIILWGVSEECSSSNNYSIKLFSLFTPSFSLNPEIAFIYVFPFAIVLKFQFKVSLFPYLHFFFLTVRKIAKSSVNLSLSSFSRFIA